MHTMPIHGEYNVAEHTYNMLCMLLELYPFEVPIRLVQVILHHDAAERITGDTPGPAKKAAKYLNDQLTGLEDLVLNRKGLLTKWAINEHLQKWVAGLDALEFYLWAQDQLALGNRNVEDVIPRMEGWLDSMDLPKPVKECYEQARERGWFRGADDPRAEVLTGED
jgi:5'-deoxynucleotidase YfbR-like HD superfamily hydrolase